MTLQSFVLILLQAEQQRLGSLKVSLCGKYEELDVDIILLLAYDKEQFEHTCDMSICCSITDLL